MFFLYNKTGELKSVFSGIDKMHSIVDTHQILKKEPIRYSDGRYSNGYADQKVLDYLIRHNVAEKYNFKKVVFVRIKEKNIKKSKEKISKKISQIELQLTKKFDASHLLLKLAEKIPPKILLKSLYFSYNTLFMSNEFSSASIEEVFDIMKRLAYLVHHWDSMKKDVDAHWEKRIKELEGQGKAR